MLIQIMMIMTMTTLTPSGAEDGIRITDDGAWRLVRTREGCGFVIPEIDAQDNRAGLVFTQITRQWTGNCGGGGLASGTGTLITEFRRIAGSESVMMREELQGTASSGLWEGEVTKTFYLDEGRGMRTITYGDGSISRSTDTFVAGCISWNTDCDRAAGRRASAAVRARGAASYFGGDTSVSSQRVEGAAPASTAGMVAEVAEAYRTETDPAIRARLVRDAALYARNRPTLAVRANTGTGCVRPELANFRFHAVSEHWMFEIKLTNTCSEEQLSYAEMHRPGAMYGSLPNLWTVGFFPTRWDARRDPGVGFTPHNPQGDTAQYRLRGGATNAGSMQLPARDSTNQIEVWIGSCNAFAPGRVGQVMFRPAAAMQADPRVACVPGLQGRTDF